MVEQLVKNIADCRKQLALLERKLKDIQYQCAHEFHEQLTHRTCLKCYFVESYHY